MSEVFAIAQALVDEIHKHARAEAPREACGMIGGTNSVAEKVYPTPNSELSEITYNIDPADAFSVIRQMRTDGLDFIACYHSHPASEAYPSPTDKAKAGDSDLIYAIISLAKADPVEFRAFKMNQGQVDELIIEVSS